MEIIKVGMEVADSKLTKESAYNAVYPASCNDVGCVCDDCVDGG